MISVLTNQSGIENELGELIRLFYHDTVAYTPVPDAAHTITHLRTESAEGAKHTVSMDGEVLYTLLEEPIGTIEGQRLNKYTAKLCLYFALVKATGRHQPWGSLTGVRPVKMLSQLNEMGLNGERVLRDTFGVSESRIALSRAILKVQQKMTVPKDSFGIYIGIPFCVSRCHYCSFPGMVAKPAVHEAYFDALCLEMEAAAAALSSAGKTINSLYIGGGTPTSFSEELTERLLCRARSLFPDVEFTLEAGRPDTITKAKLLSAKRHGVTRLCINPQTMNDKTLATITRSHGAKDIVACYDLARSLGFTHINADLIAGLSGEDFTDFAHTMEEITRIAPESVTIHTLALKRGSKIKEQGYEHEREGEIAQMVDHGRETLMALGYRPYYLYRQKYMAGNLENVGYAKEGKECLYNVCMMDDLSSVLALGAGAISKIITGSRIERHPNAKDVKLYMERIEGICAKYAAILR
ncbi:MAG: coproporphyrinogen dehydrogenase HemZ [Clostridiales bacterium]|nr:coproporphyrinogen dehydrogenase HemZ [Clostridiales bacterium]